MTIGGDVEAWRSIGLTVSSDGRRPAPRHVVANRLTGPRARGDRLVAQRAAAEHSVLSPGIRDPRRKERRAGRRDLSIDGLRTEWVEAAGPTYAAHPLGCVEPRSRGGAHARSRADERDRSPKPPVTSCGVSARSARCGRASIGSVSGAAGGLIVELVERPDIEPGPAAFWGIVLIVDDLDAACDLIGPDRISPPKDAVQPGRRIATVRSDAGLEHPRRPDDVLTDRSLGGCHEVPDPTATGWATPRRSAWAACWSRNHW